MSLKESIVIRLWYTTSAETGHTRSNNHELQLSAFMAAWWRGLGQQGLQGVILITQICEKQCDMLGLHL